MSNNVRIHRDNRFVHSLNLPTFTVYNMRSIWSKINNLAEDIEERNVDISFLSEVWEKKESKKHQKGIENLLEMKGISYISTPRPGTKRGGGTAIAANPVKFFLSKLNIEIPKPIEVVWGLLRPKKVVGSMSKIILCSFYSPPNSKKNNLLIDHITFTLNKLKLLAIDPNFHQIVSLPTLNNKILDIVITDLHRFYVEPVIINPIEVDVLGKGVPSDHSGVFVPPLDSNNTSRGTTKEVKHVRPLPESDITLFGESIKSIDWSSLLLEDQSSTALVDIFETITLDLVDIHFPLKEITITAFDKPWMTEELKALRRSWQ